MKRFIYSAIIVLFAALSVNAQSKSDGLTLLSDVANKTNAQKQADTVANAGTKTQTVKIAGFQSSVSVQATVTRISGTVNAKVYLMGSLTGNANEFEKADSVSLVNVATPQVKVFSSVPSKYVFYRVQVTGGSGATQSLAVKSYAVFRKAQ